MKTTLKPKEKISFFFFFFPGGINVLTQYITRINGVSAVSTMPCRPEMLKMPGKINMNPQQFHVFKKSTTLHEIARKGRVMWNFAFKSKLFLHCICTLQFLNISLVEDKKACSLCSQKIQEGIRNRILIRKSIRRALFLSKIYVLVKVRSLPPQLGLKSQGEEHKKS